MVPGAGPVDDATVIVLGRRVLDAGPRRRVLAGFSGPVTDLGPVCLVPGLVNAHTHLELSHLRGRSPKGRGFAAWAGWLARQRLTEPGDALSSAVASAATSGTGAVIDIGSRSGTAVIRALGAAALPFLYCHESFGFRPLPEPAMPPLLDAALAEGPGAPALGAVTASGHALYSTSPDNLRRARMACLERKQPFCLHLAEQPGELELLATGRGELADLLRGRVLPRDFQPPGCSPVAYAHTLGLLGPASLAVHGVWLTPADRQILAVSGTTVCLCPRSNAHIGVGTADAPALVAAGIPVCLGTDSLASNDDLDLWNEVRALLADHPDFPAQAILPALTTTPARLLGRPRELGLLAPGALGGYAVVPEALEGVVGGG
jgi:aminodeoxyfutalosine deaminase